jgi:hypothetical protein
MEATVFTLRASGHSTRPDPGGVAADQGHRVAVAPPRTDTPADVFGRVRGAGRYGRGTAMASPSRRHRVRPAHPLAFTASSSPHVLTTGRSWAGARAPDDPAAGNYA